MERWIEYTKKADFTAWGKALGITPMTARLLRNRDITDEAEADNYLHGTMADLHDPYLMKDMKKAADILSEAVGKRAAVAIVSDFDDDGIFAGQILYEGLKKLGAVPLVFTPNRVREGYGINRRIIDQAKKEGCQYILTCDNGIAAVDEVAYAKSLGLTVIVTDHHEMQLECPPADAVIDPKQPGCGYPFKELCGAGVAFRLIQVLYRIFGIPESEEEKLYEYAAIATVADVVELKGENRILVKAGLEKLHHTDKMGLRALCEKAGVEPQKLNSYHLGFVIGPCFNAVGRLSDVKTAFDLLNATDEVTALELASEITALNEERKDQTEKGTELALSIAEHDGIARDRVMVIRLSGIHESVVGIIAGRLKERYNKPVFVFTESGEFLKGSGRSIEGYHMLKALLPINNVMERFGGHAMAAGVTIRPEKLNDFRNALNAACTLKEDDFVKKVYIDMRLPLSYISEPLIREFSCIEPFGTGNSRPVFARPHFRIHQMRLMGKMKNMLKLVVSDGSGATMEAVMFRDAEEFLRLMRDTYGDAETEKAFRGADNQLDAAFVFYPDVNEFRNTRTLQITVEHFCVIPQN